MSFKKSELNYSPKVGYKLKKRVKAELSEDQRQEVKEAFDLFDTERNGFIDYHELKVILRALGFEAKKADILSTLREYDTEETGKIEFTDFLDLSFQLPLFIQCLSNTPTEIRPKRFSALSSFLMKILEERFL